MSWETKKSETETKNILDEETITQETITLFSKNISNSINNDSIDNNDNLIYS